MEELARRMEIGGPPLSEANQWKKGNSSRIRSGVGGHFSGNSRKNQYSSWANQCLVFMTTFDGGCSPARRKARRTAPEYHLFPLPGLSISIRVSSTAIALTDFPRSLRSQIKGARSNARALARFIRAAVLAALPPLNEIRQAVPLGPPSFLRRAFAAARALRVRSAIR